MTDTNGAYWGAKVVCRNPHDDPTLFKPLQCLSDNWTFLDLGILGCLHTTG